MYTSENSKLKMANCFTCSFFLIFLTLTERKIGSSINTRRTFSTI